MSLREKTVSGISWSLAEQFGSKIVGFVISIILARLLLPEQFGLIAMLSIFISIGNSLMDSGLTSSLIRTNDANQRDYSTIFFFNLIGSVLIYSIIYIAAPLISGFYKQSLLTNIIRVYSISFIINAFFSIQSTRLTKEMNFKAQTAIKVPSSIVGGISGIVMAKMGLGVWSLVAMYLLNSFCSTLLHWIYSDWRPSFLFDRNSFKRHFFFGYKMTISGLLETLYQNIYVVIIGKNYPASQLGFYSRADTISQLPISNISIAINKVTYPVLAKISDDSSKLKEVYRQLLQQIIFCNTPILICLSVIAEPLFRFLLTEKWLTAVPYFQILCLAGISYPLHSYNLNILKVKGRSDLLLQLELVKKVISIVGIICVIPYGVLGLLYFQLAFSFVSYLINSFYSGKIINYPVKEQVADVYPSLLLASIAGYICYLFDFYLSYYQVVDLARIIISSFIYFAAYLGASYLLKLTAITNLKHLILRK
ncbi:lipopolysaccharide biosynthesis protein [Desertivirga arenae]|uniref:lipopolysaccharide biosynthesis protein n=1 Tax=Desertivirga arenae TaxID=2810309 RepID=UPI001A95DC76|nr:lipopolysaccharide biosynthesis protein [Pedobacter sp. SYSU D00823]